MFEELQRGKSTSRIAFMAMQFGDAELDGIYKDHFKIGVATSGFDLKRVDEGQPAGLIDDLLRVKIRQCRFLIADLTHQNRGAYWEAGYAEGLGKPVIYTCRKDVFESKSEGTHFDTNHHLTVVWERDRLDDAVEKLKATIRATLPDEAKFDA
jgi:nucleoside 2-deoxyribosyltransferase